MTHNMRFTAGKFCRVTTRDNFFPAGRLLPQNCHTKRWKTSTEMWHTAALADMTKNPRGVTHVTVD